MTKLKLNERLFNILEQEFFKGPILPLPEKKDLIWPLVTFRD